MVEMRLHLSHHRLTPDLSVLDPQVVGGFFLGYQMAIFLKAEYKTTITGDGDGFIQIEQVNECGEISVVFISVNQFDVICDFRDDLINEALGKE